MAAYENTTCHTRVHVLSCVSARVRTCVRASVINEKAPFLIKKGLDYLSIFICAEDVASCGASNRDRQSSLK